VTRYTYVLPAAGPRMTPFARYARYLRIALLIELIFVFSNVANTAEVNPLRPVDTSSPRATLQGFVGTMDEIYRGMKDFLQEYAASQRLYPTPDERRKQVEALSTAAKAIKVLDLSDIPPVLRNTVAPERAIQLKEILDRIEFPSFESIPDQEVMARASSKRWRLPGTEIDIGAATIYDAKVWRGLPNYRRCLRAPHLRIASRALSMAAGLITG
jgi:MscS family membrane protein